MINLGPLYDLDPVREHAPLDRRPNLDPASSQIPVQLLLNVARKDDDFAGELPPLQRCGGETHAGCPCADTETPAAPAVQRYLREPEDLPSDTYSHSAVQGQTDRKPATQRIVGSIPLLVQAQKLAGNHAVLKMLEGRGPIRTVLQLAPQDEQPSLCTQTTPVQRVEMQTNEETERADDDKTEEDMIRQEKLQETRSEYPGPYEDDPAVVEDSSAAAENVSAQLAEKVAVAEQAYPVASERLASGAGPDRDEGAPDDRRQLNEVGRRLALLREIASGDDEPRKQAAYAVMSKDAPSLPTGGTEVQRLEPISSATGLVVSRQVAVPFPPTAPPVEIPWWMAGLAGPLLLLLIFGALLESDSPRPKCPPCPNPPPPRVDRVPPSTPHWPCPGDHWHYQVYNQDPVDCKCYLSPWKLGGCCGQPPFPDAPAPAPC